ncbi:MAG: hypothetical protein K8R12_06705 [Desulfobacterales bacterium]|nr:hypothetical protein [Desulfobacterales bacterium]
MAMKSNKITAKVICRGGSANPYIAEFRVDPAYPYCLAPRSALSSAGISIEGTAHFGWKSCTEPIRKPCGYGWIEVMGEETLVRLVWPPPDVECEPIIGREALERLGMRVDSSTGEMNS